MDTLNGRALRALFRLLVGLAVLLFLSAGTLQYWQAWLYLAIFMGSTTVVTVDLMLNDRALLERRLRAGPSAEREPTQKAIIRAAAVAFAILLTLPGIERRLGYASSNVAASVAGDLLVVFGFAIVWRVYRENSFTSAAVRVEDTQLLVSSGPYAIVRHPMYSGAACCIASTPLALGSTWAAVPALTLVLLMVWRIHEEERVLKAELPGYVEYARRVRHRLLPFVW